MITLDHMNLKLQFDTIFFIRKEMNSMRTILREKIEKIDPKLRTTIVQNFYIYIKHTINIRHRTENTLKNCQKLQQLKILNKNQCQNSI